MKAVVSESVAELLGILLYAAIAGALSIVGALAELAGVADLQAGQLTIGLWEAAFGLLLLYAGYSVASTFVLGAFRDEQSADA